MSWQWTQQDKYYISAVGQPYRICKVMLRGEWTYELWWSNPGTGWEKVAVSTAAKGLMKYAEEEHAVSA